MTVAVIPEYDQPRVLVTYRAEFAADVAMPLKMQLRLPADAQLGYVCSLGPNGDENPNCVQFTTKVDGDVLLADFEVTTPRLYVEYHYGTVSGTTQRDLDFRFLAPFTVKTLDVVVQQPEDATSFMLTPAATNSFNEQGFQHYIYSYTDLAADAPVTFNMTYARPTDQPLAVLAEAQATAAAAGEAVTQPDENSNSSPALIGVLAVAGLGALGLVAYRTVLRRGSRPAPAQAAVARRSAGGFCRHCGQQLRQGAAFCPGCGQQTRAPAGGAG